MKKIQEYLKKVFEKKANQRIGAFVIGVLIIGLSFAIGFHVGTKKILALEDTSPALPNGEVGKPGSVDFSIFWQVWNDLNEKYVPTHNKPAPTDQEKVWGAIEGLAASYGDPYTTFFPPAESQDFESQIEGNFDGIGTEIGVKDGVITVIAPLKGTPAYTAGIKAGDEILKINGTSTENISADEAVNLIRGPKGTTVTLNVLSIGAKQPRDVAITRDTIDIPTIDTKTLPGGIFVISLYSFSENSPDLFQKALQQFVQTGDDKLILDLRGNPGGFLDAAVDMASWFLPADKVIVTEDTAGHGQNTVFKSLGYDVFDKNNGRNPKMVILIDGGSASASEILAGALEQQGVAKLVGTQSFGKGSVQELEDLSSGTSLKVTVARWLTPNGTSISDHGLTPDYIATTTDDDLANGKDPQMDEAVKVLNQ